MNEQNVNFPKEDFNTDCFHNQIKIQQIKTEQIKTAQTKIEHIKIEQIEQIKITMPDKVKTILNQLIRHGFEAYAVGGCVRDSLLDREPGDWDITTSAMPMQVKELFPRTVDTGLQHGTVTVMSGNEGFEVTTYRIDGKYEDGRHPKEVTFTRSLFEDLKRRDFTINAMAYNEQNGLVDVFDGIGDLRRGVVQCVGSPQERFREDALRMLRAVRFSAQLGFTIADGTAQAIRELAPDLSKISAERIREELLKLIISPHPERLRELCRLGISKIILPEWDLMLETEQNHPHHCYSVGEHTIQAMLHVESDKILRLAMLFHDIAKPVCHTVDTNGTDHFYGHPAKSADMAKQIFRRLKFDRNTMDAVCALVYWHDYNPQLTEEKVRRAMIKVGCAQYPAVFAVKRADILAQSEYQRMEKLAYVDAYEQMYKKIIEQGDCLGLKQLAVSGKDLMELGIRQGKQIGKTLNYLLELVIEEPDRNERKYLLEQVRKRMEKEKTDAGI